MAFRTHLFQVVTPVTDFPQARDDDTSEPRMSRYQRANRAALTYP